MTLKKKKKRIYYFTGDGVIEIIIRDSSGRKEAKFVSNQSDSKQLRIIARILKDKYGINLIPSTEKPGFFDY